MVEALKSGGPPGEVHANPIRRVQGGWLPDTIGVEERGRGSERDVGGRGRVSWSCCWRSCWRPRETVLRGREVGGLEVGWNERRREAKKEGDTLVHSSVCRKRTSFSFNCSSIGTGVEFEC